MALSLRRGSSPRAERHPELVRLEVDGLPCVAYPRLTAGRGGRRRRGQRAARLLGLGSGGFDVLHANLTRGFRAGGRARAHVMKLPTLGCRRRCGTPEGTASSPRARRLPVVCCVVQPACAVRGPRARPARVATSSLRWRCRLAVGRGAALKAPDGSRSRSPRVTVDGDVACVTVASALAWIAARQLRRRRLRSAPGSPAPRRRSATARSPQPRRRTWRARSQRPVTRRPLLRRRRARAPHGVSHHTRAALDLCLGDVAVAWPAGLDCAGVAVSPRGRGRPRLARGVCRAPARAQGRGPDETRGSSQPPTLPGASRGLRR